MYVKHNNTVFCLRFSWTVGINDKFCSDGKEKGCRNRKSVVVDAVVIGEIADVQKIGCCARKSKKRRYE